ncbi:MAG TPA: glycerol-3-phosphate acyltransferase, partial [Rhodospirillales bacterium]|nr:glycerol-3-phosphate acyltransferase [Rhodospirillales bacterium]
RYSSLAALVALSASPFYAWWLIGPEVTVLAALLAILSIIRHHENVTRLLKGEESKIGGKKD